MDKTIETTLDVRGLRCPMPLLKTKLALNALAPGQVLEILASDEGSLKDIPAYLRLSVHELLELDATDSACLRFVIQCHDSDRPC